MPEQRQAERLGISAVRGEVLVLQPLVITELSRIGMTVETACPLLVESLHEFRLTLDRQTIVVKGRVAHSRISDVDRDVLTYLSGIEFVELSDRATAAISDFLATIRRHRGMASSVALSPRDVR